MKDDPSVADLFAGSKGIRFSVQVDLAQAEVTSDEARTYCLRQLAALGIPIIEEAPEELRGKDVPLRDLHIDKIPELRFSLRGGPVPAPEGAVTRGAGEWYQLHTGVQYWDFVVYRRNSSVTKMMPILFYNATATFFSLEEFREFATSREGIERSLDSALDRFKRSLYGEWSFDPFGSPEAP